MNYYSQVSTDVKGDHTKLETDVLREWEIVFKNEMYGNQKTDHSKVKEVDEISGIQNRRKRKEFEH
jgi:hypothetical protein